MPTACASIAASPPPHAGMVISSASARTWVVDDITFRQEMSAQQPSRLLLILAGALTQLVGASCLILGLVSLPILHDLHGGTKSVLASIVAAPPPPVCRAPVYGGRR